MLLLNYCDHVIDNYDGQVELYRTELKQSFPGYCYHYCTGILNLNSATVITGPEASIITALVS